MAANTLIAVNVTHPQRNDKIDLGNEATQFHRSTTTSNPMIHRSEPIFVVAVVGCRVVLPSGRLSSMIDSPAPRLARSLGDSPIGEYEAHVDAMKDLYC